MNKLSDFPKLHIEIFLEKGELVRSRLSLSDAFTTNAEEGSLLHRWLLHYAKKKPLPFSTRLNTLTSFQRTALQTMGKIPFGETMSYGELAAACDHPKAARAMGGACNKNPFPLFIPCHRIISADGSIGGFALDLEIKRRLLEFEGRVPPLEGNY